MADAPRELTLKSLAVVTTGIVVLLSLTVWRLGYQDTPSAPPPPSLPQTTDFGGPTMGTTYTVRISDPVSEEDFNFFALGIVEALESVDTNMSTYREDSELSQFNATLSTEPFDVSADTARVIAAALEVSRQTDGAYDITVGPLVNAWGFGPDGPQRSPDDEQIAALRSQTGFQNVKVNVGTSELWKWVSGLSCDLSSIAKGFAVDKVTETLKTRGAENFMVEVGGEVRAVGQNAYGDAWRIGIRKPLQGVAEHWGVVPLADKAMATSGDYQNFYESDGKRYSHIIDPRTGRPIESRLASVTVIHDECMMADAYATALTVMGPEAGLEFADEIGLAVVFVMRTDDGFERAASRVFMEQYPDVIEGQPLTEESIL